MFLFCCFFFMAMFLAMPKHFWLNAGHFVQVAEALMMLFHSREDSSVTWKADRWGVDYLTPNRNWADWGHSYPTFIHVLSRGSNPDPQVSLVGLFSVYRDRIKLHSTHQPFLPVLLLLVLILLPFAFPDFSKCLKGNQSKCRITSLHLLHHLDLTLQVSLDLTVLNPQISNVSV